MLGNIQEIQIGVAMIYGCIGAFLLCIPVVVLNPEHGNLLWIALFAAIFTGWGIILSAVSSIPDNLWRMFGFKRAELEVSANGRLVEIKA